MTMPKFLQDMLTGKDGETHDVARHSWLYSLIALIGGGIYNAIHAGAVDLVQFGTAVAAIVGAHGAAIWGKAKTEPDAAPPDGGAK